MVQAVRDASSHILMNQLTDLSSGIGPANSALRQVSSAALAAAADAAGVRQVVAQSVRGLRRGSGPRPGGRGAGSVRPDPRGSAAKAVAAVERGAAEHASGSSSATACSTAQTPGTRRQRLADQARPRTLVADGDVSSFVHVEAARAAVAALDWPSGVVNV